MSFGDYAKNALRQIGNHIKNSAKMLIIKLLPYILIALVIFVIIAFIISIIASMSANEAFALEEGYVNMDGGIYGTTVEEKVWYTLRNAGYSEISVAGVMGNIYAESNFKADLVEYGYTFTNGGIGLCQWTSYPRTSTDPNDRKNRLINYAQSKGLTWSDEDTQIEYLLGELNTSGGANGYAIFQMGGTHYGYTYNSWKNATDISTAAKAFMACFERPNMALAHTSTREQKAQEYYDMFHGKTAPAAGFSGPATPEAMHQLEKQLERDHNLVEASRWKSGNGFSFNWNTENVTPADKARVTGAYVNNGLEKYQCTWWAVVRANEYLAVNGTKYKVYPRISDGTYGNGGDFFRRNKNNGWFEYGTTPRVNAVFSTPTSTIYGHVAYVEGVDANGGFYTSEAGGGKRWAGIIYHGPGAYKGDGVNYGFIYIDKPR